MYCQSRFLYQMFFTVLSIKIMINVAQLTFKCDKTACCSEPDIHVQPKVTVTNWASFYRVHLRIRLRSTRQLQKVMIIF